MYIVVCQICVCLLSSFWYVLLCKFDMECTCKIGGTYKFNGLSACKRFFIMVTVNLTSTGKLNQFNYHKIHSDQLSYSTKYGKQTQI